MSLSFRARVEQARRDQELHFASLLPEQLIDKLLGAARDQWQGWVYRPAIVVWCFLAQTLSADHGCRETVAKLIAHLVSRGRKPCSPENGAYCTARDQLPEEFCHDLIGATSADVSAAVPQEWRWLGRRVCVVDGSTATMADTEENRAEYTQPPGQKRGCGFPILRFVVVFCLASGVALEMALGKYEGKQTGENSLFRSIDSVLASGDVLLADRYFSGWFDIALRTQRGIDVVVRKHQLRDTDFRRGRRLGKDDQLVTWPKPARPAWMEQSVYDALPDELTVREVRVRVDTPGFRVQELIVVTTLLDPFEVSRADLADLFRQRWQAELHLRSLKTVMQMDHLRCKAPHRVRNELRMHLVAYNLIRGVMVEAARRNHARPAQISFKGTMQTVNQFLPVLNQQRDVLQWIEALLGCIASHIVGNRPDRVEPRVRKRRPKKYKLMTKPRAEYKKAYGK
jgi:hypothetical protein